MKISFSCVFAFYSGFFEQSEFTYENTPFHNLHKDDKDDSGSRQYDYFDDEDDDEDEDDIPGKFFVCIRFFVYFPLNSTKNEPKFNIREKIQTITIPVLTEVSFFQFLFQMN